MQQGNYEAIKEKINKSDFIKIENFDTLNHEIGYYQLWKKYLQHI